MSPALISSFILLAALVLFISDRMRHDLVAVVALIANMVFGIVAPEQALAGFSDPAVIAVAAVLVVGRAVELSGVASTVTGHILPDKAPFEVQLFIIMIAAAVLSAFMNNIAALVITMPVASKLALDANKSPTAALMPLAFATILGGMTTLIGTPPNLILSSIRADTLGAPLGFFQMSGVGLAVALPGLLYMALFGFRLLPERRSAMRATVNPWRVFELVVPDIAAEGEGLSARLRRCGGRLLRVYEPGEKPFIGMTGASIGRRILVLSRKNPWTLAEDCGFMATHPRDESEDAVTIRAAVAHGSFLIGRNYDVVAARTDGRLAIVAAGPRAARMKRPLNDMYIQPGDQLFIHGSAATLAEFIANARLLEIGRHDTQEIDRSKAAAILGIFALAIAATVIFGINPAITFFTAAAVMAGMRLLPSSEVYRAIDWPVILLLAAMIPVGQGFQTSGAAADVSAMLSEMLSSAPLWVSLFALGLTTLLLSAILNNVATAIIMGPIGIQIAQLRDFPPDAALLMVLIGASAAFLTPIGHQNNLLVMGPGGYKFSDFAKLGAPLSVIVLAVASLYLTAAVVS